MLYNEFELITIIQITGGENMKQFVFYFETGEKKWKEVLDANGMFDALKRVKARKSQLETETKTLVRIELKGINYSYPA